jgi:surface antigen
MDVLLRTGSKLLAAHLLVAFVLAIPAAHAADPFRRSGFRLDGSDYALLGAAAERLYLDDGVAVGSVETWDNPETGNHGTVTLVGKHKHQDMPCRRLQHDIEVKRTRDPYRFTVDRCRTDDGEWKILTQ